MPVEEIGERIRSRFRMRGGIDAVGREVGIGRRREQAFDQQRRVDAAVQRDIAHRQRADGFAVIAVFQRDEFGASAVVAVAVAEPVERHLQRHFHPGRPVVGIEHFVERSASCLARRDGEQPLRQLDRRRMRDPGQDHVLQGPRLPRDGLGDARLAVAMDVCPPAADRIQCAAAVVTDQPSALAARDRQQGQGVGMLAHLRAGVPEHREIARAPAPRGILARVARPAVVYDRRMRLHAPIIACPAARRVRPGAA